MFVFFFFLKQSVNSVFSRLGGKSEATKRPLSSTSFDDIVDSSSLPYVGVLKNSGSPSPAKKAKTNISLALKAKNIRIKKTIQPSSSSESKSASKYYLSSFNLIFFLLC